MEAERTRTITVTWHPEIGKEPTVYSGTEKAGYGIESAENGGNPTYRLYLGRQTVLVPAANVLHVEMDL